MSIAELVHNEKITIDPDLHMARLLTKSFGYPITPEQVQILFRHHWSKLQVMAHAIHDQQVMQES